MVEAEGNGDDEKPFNIRLMGIRSSAAARRQAVENVKNKIFIINIMKKTMKKRKKKKKSHRHSV